MKKWLIWKGIFSAEKNPRNGKKLWERKKIQMLWMSTKCQWKKLKDKNSDCKGLEENIKGKSEQNKESVKGEEKNSSNQSSEGKEAMKIDWWKERVRKAFSRNYKQCIMQQKREQDTTIQTDSEACLLTANGQQHLIRAKELQNGTGQQFEEGHSRRNAASHNCSRVARSFRSACLLVSYRLHGIILSVTQLHYFLALQQSRRRLVACACSQLPSNCNFSNVEQ